MALCYSSACRGSACLLSLLLPMPHPLEPVCCATSPWLCHVQLIVRLSNEAQSRPLPLLWAQLQPIGPCRRDVLSLANGVSVTKPELAIHVPNVPACTSLLDPPQRTPPTLRHPSPSTALPPTHPHTGQPRLCTYSHPRTHSATDTIFPLLTNSPTPTPDPATHYASHQFTVQNLFLKMRPLVER